MKEVANVAEIPEGTMKHIEVENREILLSNVNGNIYATDDRCGHMCASLATGALEGNIVICSMHKGRFDVKTGKKEKYGQMGGVLGRTKIGKAISAIKTYDLRTYKVLIDGDRIMLEL